MFAGVPGTCGSVSFPFWGMPLVQLPLGSWEQPQLQEMVLTPWYLFDSVPGPALGLGSHLLHQK